MRNPEIATKLQNALKDKGWTVKDWHTAIARKTEKGDRPSRETLRRWVADGGGRIHSDAKPDLERAVKALGFVSLDALTTDPDKELFTLVEAFLTRHFPGYNTEKGAMDFLAIPQCQEMVAALRAKGLSAAEIFGQLMPGLKVVFHGLFVKHGTAEIAPESKPIPNETQQPSIETLISQELLKQVLAILKPGVRAKWQQELPNVKPDEVPEFVEGLMQQVRLRI